MRILALVLCICLLPTGLSFAEDDEVPGPRPAPPEGEEPGARPGRRGGNRGGRGGGRAERLKRMDTNGDGEISRDEWRGPPQFFERMDADGDGVISGKEMDVSGRTGRGQGQGGQRSGQRGGGLQPDAMDADKDGKISKKEIGDWFEKSDKNGDGFVDKDEWTAASSGRALRDPAPKVGDAAPKVSAKSLVGMDTVDLAQMTRLTVLIFGSHT